MPMKFTGLVLTAPRSRIGLLRIPVLRSVHVFHIDSYVIYRKHMQLSETYAIFSCCEGVGL